MKRTANRIIIISILLVFPVILNSGGEWKLIIDKDGIALYARDVSGHAEAQFKGVCVVNRSLKEVGSVLSDIASYPKWFFKCIGAKKIPAENSSKLHFYLYVAIDTPWPFSDRDAVYKTEVKIDYSLGKVLIQSMALIEPIIPLKKQYVRITDSEHQWILERISTDSTRITFINRTNAAGPFANFISNPGVRDTMIYSLTNLSKILKHQDDTEIIKQWDSPSDFIQLVGHKREVLRRWILDLKRGSNKDVGPKDFFEMGSIHTAEQATPGTVLFQEWSCQYSRPGRGTFSPAAGDSPI